VGELEGDAWSGAGAGESLGRRGTTACGGAAAGQRSGAEEEEQGVALGADLQFQKFQGPYCKLKFSTILKLKWENGQNKSYRTFKPYNFYLGLQTKNSKDRTLFLNFGLNSNFSKFLS
jgi:hypothetical protein